MQLREDFEIGTTPEEYTGLLDEEHREEVTAGRVAKSEVHKEIRAFYARDKGKTIVEEFLAGFGVESA